MQYCALQGCWRLLPHLVNLVKGPRIVEVCRCPLLRRTRGAAANRQLTNALHVPSPMGPKVRANRADTGGSFRKKSQIGKRQHYYQPTQKLGKHVPAAEIAASALWGSLEAPRRAAEDEAMAAVAPAEVAVAQHVTVRDSTEPLSRRGRARERKETPRIIRSRSIKATEKSSSNLLLRVRRLPLGGNCRCVRAHGRFWRGSRRHLALLLHVGRDRLMMPMRPRPWRVLHRPRLPSSRGRAAHGRGVGPHPSHRRVLRSWCKYERATKLPRRDSLLRDAIPRMALRRSRRSRCMRGEWVTAACKAQG